VLPVFFAEIVSIGSGVICYHDWFLGGWEGTYCESAGKSDTFVGLRDKINESLDAAACIV
jgi:hypothetical protein